MKQTRTRGVERGRHARCYDRRCCAARAHTWPAPSNRNSRWVHRQHVVGRNRIGVLSVTHRCTVPWERGAKGPNGVWADCCVSR
eukprot:5140943-Prymnesium_polylepis.2